MKKFPSLIILAMLLLYPGTALSQPSTPTLAASTDGLNVTLAWSSIPGATGYRLIYAPLPYTGPFSIGQIDVANDASFSATLWEGASFAVAVQAYNESEAGSLSNIEQFLITDDSENYQLPDTGIDACYDTAGEVACPAPGQPFYGQDAQYEGARPDYLDNGGGVVTDLNSGLIWQQDDGGAYGNFGEAIDYCESLVFDEKDDWRLPEVRELESIVDPSRYEPAIDPVFTCYASGYWSRSTHSEYFQYNNAYYVHFESGSVLSSVKRYNKYIRCVRGGLPGKSYADHGDGAVTDSATGLMWQRGDLPGDGGVLTWQEALAYCRELTLGGKMDWRLPNRKELFSILDWSPNILSVVPTAIDPVFTCSPSGYWSSSTSINRVEHAWIVDFRSGFVAGSDKGHYLHARCVRDGL